MTGGWRMWMPDLLDVLDRIATALERIADQGDHDHNRQEPDGETPPPRPVP